MISVLIRFRRETNLSAKTAILFSSPTLMVVFVYLKEIFKALYKKTCDMVHKSLLRRKRKSRYQSASVTVEASIAFPIFFFAVMYLIQMFFVLRAEVVIAETGITVAREVATYAYAAERLAGGENAVAETLLEVFDQKIVQDVAMTTMFYARCDNEVLGQAGVAQGLGGIWVGTETSGAKNYAEIHYRVEPSAVLTKGEGRFYVMRIAYRDWTGEGELQRETGGSTETGNTVYMTEHGSVYHRKRNCSYIKIDVTPVLSEHVGSKRNASGAKYYACEFCTPVLCNGMQVFVTEYGTRYHEVSTCSAIKRTVKECNLDEVKNHYRACSKCGKEEGET